MGFPTSVADDVLVRCGRHCCLCGKYAGQKIELHHIKQVAVNSGLCYLQSQHTGIKGGYEANAKRFPI